MDLNAATARFPSVFARRISLSLGRVEGAGAAPPHDKAVRALQELLEPVPSRRLHVVTTDQDDDIARDRAETLRGLLLGRDRSREQGSWRKQVEPRAGEIVATVVLVDEDAWVGLHVHAADVPPFPGGRMMTALPVQVPSRAWLKLEEATQIFSIPFQAGERALELGSAPGGATRNLLDRGLEVIGVDPNEMDPEVLAHPRFTHVQTTSTNVVPESVPPLDWILLDVNVPPGTALRGALPFVRAAGPRLRGLVFTLKMKSWDLAAEIPGWLRRVGAAAPHLSVHARQLSSNGQEICVVGLRTPPSL